MPAKSALRDLTLDRTRKWHTHVLQLDDSPRRIVAHDLYRVLIAQIIGAFHRIDIRATPDYPLPDCPSAAQTPPCAAPVCERNGCTFVKTAHENRLPNFHRRAKPCSACAYDYYVKLMCHEFLFPAAFLRHREFKQKGGRICPLQKYGFVGPLPGYDLSTLLLVFLAYRETSRQFVSCHPCRDYW